MQFNQNKGKIINHNSRVSVLSIKNIIANNNESDDSIIEIISITDFLNPIVIQNNSF